MAESGLPCGFQYPTYRCNMPESVHRGEHPFQPYERRTGERRSGESSETAELREALLDSPFCRNWPNAKGHEDPFISVDAALDIFASMPDTEDEEALDAVLAAYFEARRSATINVVAHKVSPPEYPGLALVPVADLERLEQFVELPRTREGYAASGASSETAGLDVERLARALVAWAGSYPEFLDDGGRTAARRIAAEYARLASQDDTP